ncbi:hypothetical protein BASA81_007776 [Batrachochytrium salamandrivorans]|nr:hypothetical protein BASA81_007776 [Batrachochytrium salamandrivorans]
MMQRHQQQAEAYQSLEMENRTPASQQQQSAASATPKTPVVTPAPFVLPSTVRSPDGTQYQIGRPLGKGGFATCYVFTDLKTGIDYAGKVVVKASLTKSATKRKLISEIEIHRSVRHRFVVPFVTSFETSDAVYMILGLCENNTLAEMLRARKRLTVSEVQYFGLQLLSGLRYLHIDCKVLHRDLKLGNLMLSKEMEIKIGDFGLAASLQSDEERRQTMCGTPNYIAPEVLDGSRTAGHSYEVDIWGFGVVLYTLLAGTPPFETTNVKQTYKKIKESQVEFPVDNVLPSSFKDLILNVLQKDPDLRLSLRQIANHPFFQFPRPPLCIPESALHTEPKMLAPALSTAELEARMNRFQINGQQQHAAPASPAPRTVVAPPAPSSSATRQQREDPTNTIYRLLHKDLPPSKAQFEASGGIMAPTLAASTVMSNPGINYVVKYRDDADFGIGALLSNGVVSIRFNDLSHLSWPLNGKYFVYCEQARSACYGIAEGQYPSPLHKKVRVMQQFKDDFLKSFQSMAQVPSPDAAFINNPALRLKDLDFVYKYQKQKHAMYLRLASGTLHMKYFDHSELAFHVSAYPTFLYVNKATEHVEFTTMERMVLHKRTEVYSRVHYMKNLLGQLVAEARANASPLPSQPAA